VVAAALVVAVIASLTGGSTGAVASESVNASSLYKSAAPGVVAIEATGKKSIDTGTGMVIDSRGDILTASHVVAGASSITVKFLDGTVRSAKVLGTDTSNASVLHVDPSGLTLHPLALGSIQPLVVGDPLAVIGDPFGYNRSLSTGVVAGLGRTIQAPNGYLVADALQTDASVNPGNSGGPLIDAQGQVVGIVDQIATGASGADQGSGVGFAIPIGPVKAELSQLEAGKSVAHPYLGIALAEASINQQGARVVSAAPGGPAAAAGVHNGDLITALDSTRVIGPSQLVAGLAALKPGDKLVLTVTRGSSTLELTATLGGEASQATSG
jgi:putative serine protease PepD